MYRFSVLIILIGALFGAKQLSAQSIEALKLRLATPTAGTNSFDGGQIVVREVGDAAYIVRNGATERGSERFSGYRVCIFFDNAESARAEAVKAKEQFVGAFPNERVYMVYENPYYKVSVGNCLSSEEAIVLKGRLTGLFPKAFIKREELVLGDLLN